MKTAPDLIFIVGNSRSGTTMMSRILGKHSSIFSFHELHFIESQISPQQVTSDYIPSPEETTHILSNLLRSQREGIYSKTPLENYRNEANGILNSSNQNISAMEVFKRYCLYESKIHNKVIACEQTPKNIYYVEEILKALPNSKFINMYRDPRDVMLSQKRRWKRRFLGASHVPFFRETLRSWLNYHPITMSKLWNSATNEASVFHANDNFLSVKFESLLNNPDEQIQNICEFLGVDYEASMAEIPQVGSSSGEDKSGTKGIDKTNQGNWNQGGLTAGEIGICQKICGPQMSKLGYETHDISNLWLWWGYYSISFIFKMTGALLFNLNRTKNLFSTIKRRFGK